MANPVTWFEITGTDSAGLQKFYKDVFGWKLTPPVKEMGNYSMLQEHEPGIGGGIGDEMGGGNRVSVYAEVDDPQKYLDRATKAGATVLMPVTTVTPDTTIAMFRDPAGNTTGILKANTQRPAPETAARKAAGGSRARASSRRSGTAKRTRTRGSARKGRTTKRAKRR